MTFKIVRARKSSVVSEFVLCQLELLKYWKKVNIIVASIVTRGLKAGILVTLEGVLYL